MKTNITVGGAALRLFLALALVLGLMPSLQTTHAFAETSANTATTATEQQAGSDTSDDSATEGDDPSSDAADTETAGQAAETSSEAAEEAATPTYHKDGGDAVLTADTAVASIGSTTYTSLAAAFSAAQSGETITLLADVSDVRDIWIQKTVTLDMQGHTITSSNLKSDGSAYAASEWYDVFWVSETGTTFTITGDGTIQGPTGEQAGLLESKDMISVGNGAKFVMENGTIASGNNGSAGMHGISVYNSASVVLGKEGSTDGPTITNWLCAVGGNNTQPTANITIYGGTYTSEKTVNSSSSDDKHATAIYMPSSGTLDIQGGAFKGQHAISTPYKTTTQTISVSGGASLTSTNGTEVIKEGNETGKTSGGVDEDYKEGTDNRTATVADATVTGTLDNKFVAEGYASDNGTITAHDYWEVNGVKYNTLLKALAAARAQGSGQTIKLLEDYTCKTDGFTTYLLPEGSTLDLNEKTLTLDKKASAVFEGVNITIENGTINSDASYPIWIGNGESYTTATVKNVASDGGANVFAASATFEDCNFDASDDQFYALYTDEAAKITVKSGSYKGGTAGFAVCADPGSEGIFVEGGTFDYTSTLANSGQKGDTGKYYDDNISVSGGSFKTTLPEKVLADNYKVVENGDGTYGVKAIYEAKIGSTGYATLAEAIEAASKATAAKDKVITLAANVNDFEGATISSDMTIDFGDYTVTGGTGKTAFTITDGNVNFTSSTGNGGVNGGSGGNNKAVKVSGGTLNIDSGNYTVGTDADGNGNATIEVWETGKVKISGGHFSTAVDWNGWYYVLNKQNDATGTFTVSGGTFENYDPAMGDDADHSADSSFCAEGYRTTKLADGSYGMTTDPVATVGGQNFLTLKAAFDAVNNGTVSDGSTITLLDDVKEVYGCTLKNGKTATLDMQGHTVTSDYSTNYSPDSKDTTSYRIFAVTDGAKLTIEGNGTIQGPESGSAACSSSDQVGMLLVQGTDSELTIKNGTIQTGITDNKGLYALSARDGATLTLGTEGGDGPTVTSGRAAIGENHQRPASNVTVYSGTYTGLRTGGTLDDPDYEATAFLATASGTKNIYGGTFIGTNAFVTRYSDNNQTINIKGGNFQSDGGKAILVGNEPGGDYDKTGTTPTRTTAVSGGTFTTEVDAEICAEGYAPTKYTNGDGKTVYGVTENYVAKIGDTTYTTLKAAVEAASDSDTIVLLQDISDFAGVEITSKTLTIDFDKYTITGKEGTDEVSVLVVGDGAKVTLKSDSGLGGINGGTGGDKNAVKSTGSGEVTILSGTYTVGKNASDGGNSAIKLCGASKVNIEGGTFSTEATNNNKYLVLDMESDATGEFTVTAGNFVGQNPEDGDDTQGGTFCASGYHGIVVDTAEDGTITYTVTPNEDKTDDDNGVATLKDVKFTITYNEGTPSDNKTALAGAVIKYVSDGVYTVDLPESANGKEVKIQVEGVTSPTLTVTEASGTVREMKEGGDLSAGALYPVVYKITYNLGKGELPAGKTNPSEYTYGTGVTSFKSPELEGYDFGGWYEKYDFTGDAVTKIDKDTYGDKVLYAKWTIKEYTVKFVMPTITDGAFSFTIPDQKLEYGDTITKPYAEPTTVGYIFDKWYTDSACTNEFTGFGSTKVEDMTVDVVDDVNVVKIYANYTQQYEVKFDAQGGTPVPEKQTVNKGKTATAPTDNPAKTGYTFKHWYTDSEDTAYVFTTAVTGNLELKAKYTANKYTVKYDANKPDGATGNPSGVPTTGETETYDTAFTIASAPTWTGYKFTGWNTDQEGVGTDYDAGDTTAKNLATGADDDDEVTLYAKWTPLTYTVTFDKNQGTADTVNEVKGDMDSQTFTYDAAANGATNKLARNTLTRAGYKFTGWATAATPAEGTTPYADAATVTDNLSTDPSATTSVTLYAQWEAQDVPYTIVHVKKGITGADDAVVVADETIVADTTKTGKAGAATTETATVTYAGFKAGNVTQVEKLAGNGTSQVVVTYERDSFNLTYNLNYDGAATQEATSTVYGSKLTKPTDPEREGYDFKGWYTDNTNYDYQWDFANDTMPAQVTTLYAKWAPKQMTVTFNVNGGTPTVPSQTVDYDTTVETPYALPTKTGYELKGWYTTDNFAEGTEFTFGTTKVTATPTTLYAKWEAKAYTITFAELPEGVTAPTLDPNTYTIEAGKATIDAPTGTKEGYTFKGWTATFANDGKKAEGESTDVIPTGSYGNVTLTAEWEPIKYKVQFDANGGTGTEPDEVEATFDATDKVFPAGTGLSKQGYTFAGWNSAAEGNGTDYAVATPITNLATVASDTPVTVYAKWTPDTYDIVYNLDEGVTMPDGAPSEYTYGTEKVIPAPITREHYTFAGWYKDYKLSESAALGKNSEDKYIISDTEVGTVSLFAAWEPEAVTITYDPNDGTTSTTTQTFDYGDVVNLGANTFSRNGYEFKGWAANATDAASKTVKYTDQQLVNDITASTTLFAVWEPIVYNITYKWVSEDEPTTEFTDVTNNEANPTTYTIETPDITSEALKDPTKMGYKINAWDPQLTDGEESGSLITKEDEDIAIGKGSYGNVTIVGTLEPITYKFKFKPGDGATGDDNKTQTFTYDTAQDLTKVAELGFSKTGYHFDGWTTLVESQAVKVYDDGASVLNALSIDGAALELTATWAPNTYTVHFDQGFPNAAYDEIVTGNMVDQTLTYGEQAELYANNFASAGYRFIGWKVSGGSDAANGEVLDDKAKVPDTSTSPAVPNLSVENDVTVTLTAQWVADSSEFLINYYLETADLSGYELVDSVVGDGTTRKVSGLTKEQIDRTFDGFEIDKIEDDVIVPEGDASYPTQINVKFNRVSYTANFMLNYEGASTTPFKNETKEYGLIFDNPTPADDDTTWPTRTGYTFSGWYKDADCTDPWDFSNDTMPYVADATANPFNLYAKWTVNPCTVTFDANAGDDTSVTQLPDAVTVDYGSTVEKKPNAKPQRNGYEFAGWYTGTDYATEWTFGTAETDGVTKVLNEDTHVYAKWDKVSYTITYAGLEGTTTTSPTTYNIEDGVKADQLANPTDRAGYKFASWSDPALTVEGAGKIAAAADGYAIAPGSYGNITVTANWTAHTYNVNLNAGGGEFAEEPDAIEATYDGTGAVYPTAEEVKLTREGYTFAGWTDANGNDHAAGDTIENLIADDDADVTVTAKWTANTYTVVFNANGGTGTVDNVKATYGDTSVNYPEKGTMAKANYDFVGWSTDPAAKATDTEKVKAENTPIENLSTDPNGVVAVYAVWKAHEYSITYTINGNAIEKPTGDDANEESYTVESGEITLNAPVLTSVLTGFYVTGWKDANGQVVASIPAGSTGNIELFGYYEGEPVNIVFTPGNGVAAADVQNMPAVENLKYGDYITTPDEPTRVGYDFDGWAVPGSGNMKDLSSLTATPDVNTATRDENGTLYMEFPAAWTPKTDTKYVVKYERQDLEGNYPTNLTEVVEGTGTTGDTITVEAKSYDGFTTPTIPADETIAGDGSTVIELKYTRNAYKVSYNMNGHGTQISDDENIKFESTLTAPAEPTDANATFEGWYDQTLTYKWDFTNDTMPASDLTLYAKWNSDKTYEVKFVDEDGNATDIPTQKVASGSHATEPYAAPEKAGYTCDYWYDADDTTQTEFNFGETGITKAYTLKPHYVANENTYYQVLHVYKGINDTPDIQKLEQAYGTTGTEIRPVPQARDGFEVESTTTDTIKGDGTGQAVITYKRIGYTLSFESTGDAVAKGMPTSTTVTYGDNIALPATPTADGYNFEGWYTDLACQFKADFTELTMPAKDTTLYVKWSKKTYTVTFDTNGGTAIPSATVTHGTTVTKPYADPTKKGYNFDGWYSDAACAKAFSFSTEITAATTVYAKWTEVEKVTVYRLFNRIDGRHLFTTDKVEYEYLADHDWNQEGVAWYSPKKSMTPVYRLYNPNSGDHHYTTDLNEFSYLGRNGWNQEGIAFYSNEDAETSVPVYRLFNPNAIKGTHLYTTNEVENDYLASDKGWKKEGIGWYALSVE